MINVGIVGANGLPPSYGGWDQLLHHLAKATHEDIRYTVYSSNKTAIAGKASYLNAEIEIVNLDANGIQSIPYDIVSMFKASRRCDVILLLGTSGALFLPFFRMFGCPIVLNIDGAEWRRDKWGIAAKSFLWLSEAIGVLFANRVISDNPEIQRYVKSKYRKSSDMIAYGGDHVTAVPFDPIICNHKFKSGEYAFKVCRIEPENNIEMILDAAATSGVNFILVGNFNNSEFGKNIRKTFGSLGNILLLDPIYDQEKLNSLRSNSGLYVHGHSVGGTNPSLVEAMCLGLNCAVFDVVYNRHTTQNSAMFFKSKDDLLGIFSQFKTRLAPQNGETMRTIAFQNFQWKTIISSYEDLITSVMK